MDKLPESSLRLVYEYDLTYRDKFDDVMIELTKRMKHRYLKDHNPTNSKFIQEKYPVTKWVCEIKLRRKCKRSKSLIKKSTPLIICGDMIYPFEHNQNAHHLVKEREYKEYFYTKTWECFVRDYIAQTSWLFRVLKMTDGRVLRLFN